MKTALALAALLAALPVRAEFSGDVKLACEAILCLSSSSRPAECSPSLDRYFGIRKKKLSDTLNARRNFLDLCPSANADENMQSLVKAIVNGAGRCEAANLNTMSVSTDSATFISNAAPAYCNAYWRHAYTDWTGSGALPRYVGTPERGGFWTEAKDYDKALAEYEARLKVEDAER
jgi:hypothetical protein